MEGGPLEVCVLQRLAGAECPNTLCRSVGIWSWNRDDSGVDKEPEGLRSVLEAGMAIFEEHLRQAVDDVLEPAWPRERRRAHRRLSWSTLGRLAGGLAVLWLLAFVVRLITGEAFPWFAFGLVTFLATVVALPEPGDRSHLRRD
jgi:hypothetical protein